MHPFLVYRKIGPIYYRISTYGVFVFSSLLLAGFLFIMFAENGKKKLVAHLIFFVLMLAVSFIGAKVVQFFFDLYMKRGDGLTVWQIFKNAGSTIMGGMIFAVAGVFIYGKIDPHRVVTWQSIDTMAAVFPLSHMVGRIGCFFGGCCYGRICENSWFSITYPKYWLMNVLREDKISFGPRLPAPLFEAAGLFVIGVLLVILLKTLKNRGQIVGLYFLLAGILRFFQEFLRGDDENRGYLGKLTNFQWASILFTVVGIGFLVWFAVRKKKGLTGPPFLPISGKEPREKDAFED